MGALAGCIIIAVVLSIVADEIRKAANATAYRSDATYWRNAYESLVKQTGRDLNDGLGVDPRKAKS